MKLLYSVLIAGMAAGSYGCGGPANMNIANTNTNQNVAPTNVNKAADAPTPAVEVAATGSLATPADAYRTAYAIRDKKDVAGMKKIMSKDVIEFLTMIGKEEKKTLEEEIATMFDRPQAKTAETRNEKISGDRATIEYLDEDGKWKTMDFVKEGADWKLSLPGKDDVKVESEVPDKKR
ncbi:MAG: hypothetical protein ABI646_05135 [Acidobacteriota bacterium]